MVKQNTSDIMFVYNRFKEVRRTFGPNDTYWADFIGHENGTSMPVVGYQGTLGKVFHQGI